MRLEFWEEMLLARENHIWYTIKQHEMKDIIETERRQRQILLRLRRWNGGVDSERLREENRTNTEAGTETCKAT